MACSGDNGGTMTGEGSRWDRRCLTVPESVSQGTTLCCGGEAMLQAGGEADTRLTLNRLG
jgi:hypothetical protein